MPRNIILLSGGPGLFDRADPEHDASWANYVTPILLQTQTAQQRRAFQAADEEVWWFIYRPAYERRWHDDVSRSDRAHEPRRIRTIRCGDHACTSYVDLLEWRARQRGWNLRWISRADEFWSRLATFSDPISRAYYWGHARENLWLTVEHNSAHAAIAPAAHEIITVASIASHSALSSKFQAASSARRHTFFGCNTHNFAQEWARVFSVNSRGYEGTLSFASVPRTGRPEPAPGCHQRDFAPGGAAESVIELVPELHSMEVFGAALRPGGHEAAMVDVDDWAATDFDGDRGFELVAVADEAILDGGGTRSSSELLRDLLAEGGATVSSHAGGSPSPAALFDACTGTSYALRQAVERNFDVLARPGQQLDEELRPGDLYVRRALGESRLAHLAVLTSGDVMRERDLESAGLYAEGPTPGWYAEVVETGAVSHGIEDRFARRIADQSGRLPRDGLLLRVIRGKTTGRAKSEVEKLGPGGGSSVAGGRIFPDTTSDGVPDHSPASNVQVVDSSIGYDAYQTNAAQARSTASLVGSNVKSIESESTESALKRLQDHLAGKDEDLKGPIKDKQLLGWLNRRKGERGEWVVSRELNRLKEAKLIKDFYEQIAIRTSETTFRVADFLIQGYWRTFFNQIQNQVKKSRPIFQGGNTIIKVIPENEDEWDGLSIHQFLLEVKTTGDMKGRLKDYLQGQYLKDIEIASEQPTKYMKVSELAEIRKSRPYWSWISTAIAEIKRAAKSVSGVKQGGVTDRLATIVVVGISDADFAELAARLEMEHKRSIQRRASPSAPEKPVPRKKRA